MKTIDNRRKFIRDVKFMLGLMTGVFFMGLYSTIRIADAKNELLYPTYDQLGKNVAVWTKEVEVVKYVAVEVPYHLTPKAQQCMKNYPEVGSKLKNLYKDWVSAVELVCRESSFNPQAINRSSGACGLPQALPCTKMNCSLDDIDCQLNWQKEYIANRYGTVTKALEFHSENGWY